MKKSILAGILISIGCVIFTSVQDKVIGSLLFSLGLLTICNLKLNLYTGKIGYCETLDYLKQMPKIFLGNFIGCLIVALLTCTFVDSSRIIDMVETKTTCDIWTFFCKSIFCGVMMYVGVEVWNHRQPGCYLAPIMAVMVFILAGFEHSVADTYYFIIALEPQAKILIPVAIIGNAIGAMATHRLQSEFE